MLYAIIYILYGLTIQSFILVFLQTPFLLFFYSSWILCIFMLKIAIAIAPARDARETRAPEP